MPASNAVDFDLRQSILEHLLAQIEATSAEENPFPHFTLTAFFPSQVYATLLRCLPPTEAYEPFGYEKNHTQDGQSNRMRFCMEDSWLRRLPQPDQSFWFTIRSVLGSRELKRAVFAKLASGLAFRYDCDRRAVADIEGFALPELFREIEGYRIKPHPDTRKKVVTMQISLAADATQAGLGTEFYRRSLHPAHWLREPRGFEIVKQPPFLPNAAYAFSVLNTLRIKSWHGRSSLASGCGVRNSILNIWYQKPEHANRDLIAERALLCRKGSDLPANL
jgi:hypothetical protein